MGGRRVKDGHGDDSARHTLCCTLQQSITGRETGVERFGAMLQSPSSTVGRFRRRPGKHRPAPVARGCDLNGNGVLSFEMTAKATRPHNTQGRGGKEPYPNNTRLRAVPTVASPSASRFLGRLPARRYRPTGTRYATRRTVERKTRDGVHVLSRRATRKQKLMYVFRSAQANA